MKLPDLREKPAFDTLMYALKNLEYNKTDSTEDPDEAFERCKYEKSFPISIIRNPLDWLSPDEIDLLYNLASRRIAEQCGRVAMPEIKRKWVIPATTFHPEVEIKLREPPLTDDNLGLKTWATSFVISKNLGVLARDYFSHLLDPNPLLNPSNHSLSKPNTRLLELGSGTGLVGITAAATLGVTVLCTDLEPIQKNLEYNIKSNYEIFSKFSPALITCQPLDWRYPEKAFPKHQEFELIIAADPLYDDYHPLVLANTIHSFLKNDSNARALVAIPFRDSYTAKLAEELKYQLNLRQLIAIGCTFNACIDDDWEINLDADAVQIESTIWQRKPCDE